MLSAIITTVVGPFVYLWRYVQLTATNVGWWVYPFLFFVLIMAICSVFIMFLALNGRVNLGGKKEWYERHKIAGEARELANNISELLSEYRSEYYQVSDEETRLLLEGGGVGVPSNGPGSRLRDKISARFANKYQSQLFQIVAAARIFVRIERVTYWELNNSWVVPHSLPEIIRFLNDLAADLEDGRERLPFK